MALSLLLSLLFLLPTLLFGQDIIITRNAEEIDAKILDVSKAEVKYVLKNQTMQHTIGVDKLFMIKYANGEKEVFQTESETNTESSNIFSKKPDDTYALPRASRKYKQFDLYDENGVKGIVIEVYDDGWHGKLISLNETKCVFFKGISLRLCKERLGLSDIYDGRKNQQKLLEYISKSNLITINNYPAIKWCISLGEGWYLPSHEELKNLYWSMTDNLESGNKVSLLCKLLNNALIAHGGKKISNNSLHYYISSTESKQAFGETLNQSVEDFMLKGHIPLRSVCFYYGDNMAFADERERGVTAQNAKERVRAFYRF